MLNSTKSILTCPKTFYLLQIFWLYTFFICCKYFDFTLLSGAKIQLILFTFVGYLINSVGRWSSAKKRLTKKSRRSQKTRQRITESSNTIRYSWFSWRKKMQWLLAGTALLVKFQKDICIKAKYGSDLLYQNEVVRKKKRNIHPWKSKWHTWSAGMETIVRPPVQQEPTREEWNEEKRSQGEHFWIDGE